MLLYSLQYSNGFPPQSASTRTLTQPHSAFTRLQMGPFSDPWTCHAFCCLNTHYSSPDFHGVCLHDLGCFDTLFLTARHLLFQCTSFKNFLFCAITWSFIGLHSLCLCFPTGLRDLERQEPVQSCLPLYALCLYIIGSKWSQEWKSA